eukprot:354287-Chlamydomonas_euryale.AAC.8
MDAAARGCAFTCVAKGGIVAERVVNSVGWPACVLHRARPAVPAGVGSFIWHGLWEVACVGRKGGVSACEGLQTLGPAPGMAGNRVVLIMLLVAGCCCHGCKGLQAFGPTPGTA